MATIVGHSPVTDADLARIEVGDGALDVQIRGQGPGVLFVHGAFVDHSFWDGVVDALPGATRIVPRMPLGSHRAPLPELADRTPRGQARRLAALITALGRGPVTVVGHDSGGAIAQVLAAYHPECVSRLVLTNCDALERFPPPAFRYLNWLARRPWLLTALARALNRFPALARSPWAFGGLTTEPLDPTQLRRWLAPSLDPAIRRDVAGFLAEASPSVTLDAADRLRHSAVPIHLVWGVRDPHFDLDLAERLASHVGATLHRVDARCYVPIDRPLEVARWVTAIAGAEAA